MSGRVYERWCPAFRFPQPGLACATVTRLILLVHSLGCCCLKATRRLAARGCGRASHGSPPPLRRPVANQNFSPIPHTLVESLYRKKSTAVGRNLSLVKRGTRAPFTMLKIGGKSWWLLGAEDRGQKVTDETSSPFIVL